MINLFPDKGFRAKWIACAAMADSDRQTRLARTLAGVDPEVNEKEYRHPRNHNVALLWYLMDDELSNGDPLTGKEACELVLNPRLNFGGRYD